MILVAFLFLDVTVENDNFTPGDLLGSTSTRTPARPFGPEEALAAFVEEEACSNSEVSIDIHSAPVTPPSVSFTLNFLFFLKANPFFYFYYS